MPSKQISKGTARHSPKASARQVHTLPQDLQKALILDKAALAKWESLTPLARNEWICWVTFVKKEETRKDHIKRATQELKQGKRRPCCWIGCIHRKDKPISPSVKGILNPVRSSNTLKLTR